MSPAQSSAVPKPLRFLLEVGSLAGMTDAELVEQFIASRDSSGEAAFAALVSRHGAMVLGTCRNLLGDRHAADDAFQAVFLVLARRAGSIRQRNLLGPWLHAVATRIARKAKAQANRRRRRETSEIDMNTIESARSQADARSLSDEDAAALHEEIGRLPERYRRAVVLCHFEGLTHTDAAVRLGCAAGTVGSLVSRARDQLRSRLARRAFSAGALVLAASIEQKLAMAAVPPALERATVQAALLFAAKRTAAAAIVSTPAIELASGALKTVALNKLAMAGLAAVALGVVVAASGVAAGNAPARSTRLLQTSAQKNPGKQPEAVPTPRLPGAVAEPPSWLKNDTPFDVEAFFASPPAQENAAPRYLEALFEFGSQVEVCFPDGPERQSRKQAVEQRLARFWPVFQSWSNDPSSVPVANLDEVISEFDTGFRKLDWAQQRPRCLFQSAVGAMAQLPHAQVAGNVGRVARLKVSRELERGELDSALRDLARLLRLSRDLLPRGAMIVGIVSSAIDRAAVENVIVPLLQTKGLTVEHCDRVLALLREHEARSIDAYSEGIRAEYISVRATLHDLIFEQARLRREAENFGNRAGPSIVADFAEPDVVSMLAPNAGLPEPPAQQASSLKSIPDLDARMARTTPEELAAQVGKLHELFRGLLGVANASALERIRQSRERPRSLEAADMHTLVTRGLTSSAFTAFVQTLASAKARSRVALGLVAVRRWQLAHNGDLPQSLQAAAKEAGIPAVPVDPYDGQPVRFAVVAGQPTIYAIGADGRDEGGRFDNARTPDTGDVLLRLPRP